MSQINAKVSTVLRVSKALADKSAAARPGKQQIPTELAKLGSIREAVHCRVSAQLARAMRMMVCGMVLMGSSAVAFGSSSPTPPSTDDWDRSDFDEELERIGVHSLLLEYGFKYFQEKSSIQTPSNTYHGAYQTWTDRYTTAPGEPLPNGMTRTSWRLYIPDRDERAVFSTYGSNRYGVELDTVLAAYRIDTTAGATGFGSLKRVAASDDKKIPGYFNRGSLLQFDAVQGQRYLIQAGSKNQGGDLLLTAFTFPRTGGLTIQPLNAYGSYGYTCHLTVNYDFYPCEDASYIVHNSTAKTLRVTAASSFGAGFTVPAPFTLAPGAAAVKTFRYSSAFVKSAAKTLSGGFTLTGKEGTTVWAQAKMPAVVSVHDLPAEEPRLQLTAKAQVLAGATGNLFSFPVAVKNIGTAPVKGCYALPASGETTLQATWAAYDPATKVANGPSYQPFDLRAGETKHILVAMRSFTDRLADPLHQKPVEVGCASASASANPPGVFDNSNVVDMTNTVKPFPAMALVNTSPQAGRLVVPAAGTVFSASFRNDGAQTAAVTAKVNDAPLVNPKSGALARYGVALCPGSSTAANCLKSSARQLPLSVAAGKTVTVKVAVKRPASVAGFENQTGGLSLLLTQPFSPAYFYVDVPLGGVTKALAIK